MESTHIDHIVVCGVEVSGGRTCEINSPVSGNHGCGARAVGPVNKGQRSKYRERLSKCKIEPSSINLVGEKFIIKHTIQ